MQTGYTVSNRYGEGTAAHQNGGAGPVLTFK
jgi:hypothetical protein